MSENGTANGNYVGPLSGIFCYERAIFFRLQRLLLFYDPYQALLNRHTASPTQLPTVGRSQAKREIETVPCILACKNLPLEVWSFVHYEGEASPSFRPAATKMCHSGLLM